jgi:hypothetical protein
MLSRPIISALVILKHSPIMHESYVEQYALDIDFKDVYETLCYSNHVEELDYHVHDNLFVSSWQVMYSTRGKNQHYKRSAFFSYCWSFWCRQDSG